MDLLKSKELALQRARGRLRVSVNSRSDGATTLDDLREEGSFRAIFPHNARRDFVTVLLNTAGGITGGDRFAIEAVSNSAAHLTLTTQAAERVYATRDQSAGVVRATLDVAAGSTLHWMPQETILFDQSALDRKLTVNIAGGGRFMMVETLVFGRAHSGEALQDASLKDRVVIHRDGQLVYFDCISMRGHIAEQLAHKAIANGAGALANIVLCAPNAEQSLDPIRQLMTPTSGVSLQSPEILVVRALATDGYALRKMLLPILDHLTYSAIPKNWRL